MVKNLLSFVMKPAKLSILACGILCSSNASAGFDFTGFKQVLPDATDGSEYLYEGTYHDYNFDLAALLCNFMCSDWTQLNSSSDSESDTEIEELKALVDTMPLARPFQRFACGEIRKNNLFARNFDGYYNDYADFIIHIDAAEGRLASVGTAHLDYFGTKTYLDANLLPDIVLNAIPLETMDGINEAGVCVGINSMPHFNMEDYVTTSTNPGAPRMCEFILTRLILDKAHNVEEALDIIRSYDIFAPNNSAMDLYHECHLIVADPTRTVVVDIFDNEIYVQDTEDKTYAHNEEDENWKINTIDPENEYDANIMCNSWQAFQGTDEFDVDLLARCGHERNNLMHAGYADVCDEASMYNLMKKVWYTNVISAETDPQWATDMDWDISWTDMKGSEGDEVRADVAQMVEMFSDAGDATLLKKYRSSLVEGTLHTVIYDMDTKSMVLIPEENDNRYGELRYSVNNENE